MALSAGGRSDWFGLTVVDEIETGSACCGCKADNDDKQKR